MGGGLAFGVNALEPRVTPTVFPTLAPSSAIALPLVVHARQTNVWKAGADQRMFASGEVVIDLGYRSMRADDAAIWLTPSVEAGESTYDVAIYLSGHVRVYESDRSDSTYTSAPELLVTTRISRSVQLEGNPISQVMTDNAVVKRGGDLRMQLANRKPLPFYVPTIVVTTAEDALQQGWIAKGPNNRIIAGPGDTQIVYGPNGKPVRTQTGAESNKKKRPRPEIFATGDEVRFKTVGNESVTIIPNGYVLLNREDGSPAIEFRAQHIVLFGPPLEKSTTKPATPAPATANPDQKALTQAVTGVYLEGDVTVDAGEHKMQAARLYFDVTTNRAVMLDATLSTVDEKAVPPIPLYMRAEEIRMLSRTEFAAHKATFSTSEFYTPHYHIGASDIYLQNQTPRDEDRNIAGAPNFAFKAKGATIDILGVPVFYWPYLAGDTSNGAIPLRRIRIGDSKTYGLSLETTWDIFALAGQVAPKNLSADLHLDYFSKRGPAGGVDATWKADDYQGFMKSYIMEDNGKDRLGTQREDINPQDNDRGRFILRHQQDLGDGLTIQIEGAYISDPNFLQQFYAGEFDTDKEQETSFYIKKQGEKDAISLLGKFNLLDFTTISDQIDDQFTTEKRPEAKYWRIGDSFNDVFTYYSESGVANLHTSMTDYTPDQLALMPNFLGLPAAVVPPNQTFRDYYKQHGWTDSNVLRGDTRQEIDMPLQLGDAKIVPYATGRVTAWDAAFPDKNNDGTDRNGDTTRLWGAGGIRSSMQFWKVYDDANSVFFNVHRLRHVIEPTFNIFASGADQDRRDLQPFDRDVEGINRASGMQLALNQRWQTKRGGEGHWRNVDWLVLNVAYNQYWNKDKADDPGLVNPPGFFAGTPVRGFFFPSRPELSLAQNSIAVDGIWRVGERARLMGEMNYSLETGVVEQFATGLAIDQTDSLAYFLGNRYIRELNTNEVTVGVDYQVTKKYELIATESYDTEASRDILTSLTVVRKLPRFNTAFTVTYDANNSDTSFVFTAWPEGFPDMGFGNRTARTPHEATPNP